MSCDRKIGPFDCCSVVQGDCLDVLRRMPDESIQCCVTSPPYWGLRDYGTATWKGGDIDCDHVAGPAVSTQSTLGGGKQPGVSMPFHGNCGKCGAIRIDLQLGLERTPEEYVAKMVEVFREVRRVLRDDGTLWLNLGDSYSSQAGQRKETDRAGIKQQSNVASVNAPSRCVASLGPKQLVGIPWRVAFALQADGWWLRSDIIWAKPNPMPESVTDRPTKSHEYLFLLTKSATYYYDADAIAEPVTESTVARLSQPTLETQVGSFRVPGKTNGAMKAVAPASWHGSSFESGKTGIHQLGRSQKDRKHDGTNNGSDGNGFQTDCGNSLNRPDGKRNKRTVWTITTQPYRDAHFAVMPEKLVEPCILAGTSAKGCCPKCGAPWERMVETEKRELKREPAHAPHSGPTKVDSTGWTPPNPITIGWQPTCEHGLDPIPCTVLDPFAGSGTVGRVAMKWQRHHIGIELNESYNGLSQRRQTNVQVKLNL